jgi:hypothetical protein
MKYLKSVSFIHILKTVHAVRKRTQLTEGTNITVMKIGIFTRVCGSGLLREKLCVDIVQRLDERK